MRHTLNDFLMEAAGTSAIASVRARGGADTPGHAGAALAASLPIARGLGIERVLLTCDEDNAGSRATVEQIGGVSEDSRSGKRPLLDRPDLTDHS